MSSQQKKRAIVITGSKQGITNPPGNPAYNASKSAIKTLAENLAHSLRSSHETTNFATHLLIPGWVFTGLTGSPDPVSGKAAEFNKPEGAWLPEQVARFMKQKMDDGKFYIICPDDEVTEALDLARIAWAGGDLTEGRPALSRWDPDWKDKASQWISKEAEERAKK